MLTSILLAFIPLFVAVDAIGVLPIFTNLTEGLTPKENRAIILQSMLTASGLAIGFILVGKAVFALLGITIGDFMVAGGAILFTLAIIDIASPLKKRRIPGASLGAVPLGTPLIVGPAVLTTCLVIIDHYGIAPTIIAVLLNILLAGAVFAMASLLMQFLGEAGTKALSKVTSLLLAAIAVMLIRKGLETFLA
jgi:multiple antibiotic resistance protein